MITQNKAVKRLILLGTVSLVSILSTGAFADSVSENGCIIKEGANPSIKTVYNPGKPDTSENSNNGVPASVTGGGVATCWPKSAVENGERFSALDKTWIKVSDEGSTKIPTGTNTAQLRAGQWIAAEDYPYTYASSGSDSGLTDEVNSIKDTNNAQQTAINNVQNQANQNTSDINSIKDTNNAQDTAINNVQNQANQNTSDINDIKDVNNAQQTAIDNVQNQANQNTSDINAIKDVNNTQNERLDGHDTDISALQEKDREHDTAISAINQKDREQDEDLSYLHSQDAISVKYVADENGNATNQIVLTGDGTGSPVSITNVAAGKSGLDAVNVNQLNGTLAALGGGAGVAADGTIIAPTYNIGGSNYNDVGSALFATNDRIDDLASHVGSNIARLDGRISDVRDEARAGIAGANALAGMRYDDRPGKGSLAMGFGGFKNATAMALGVGYTTDDGVWRVNAGVNHTLNGTSSTGWNAAMSWTWN